MEDPMGLYEITETGLEERKVETFAGLGLKEREDLQRLLREQIGVLDEDLLVIAEEFGNWQDVRRRIDLLALDPTGRLVVIELKRTDDGGHMDLQAIRYAAMVSAMSFDEVVDTYAKHVARHRPDETVDARAEIIEFLSDDVSEPTIASDVRILLVSADFGLEITMTVLWLNRLDGMDIRCIRLRAYQVDGKTLLNVEQVLPLPEAGDYQVKIRRKEAARERTLASTKDFTRYEIVVDGLARPAVRKRHAVRTMIADLLTKGVTLAEVDAVIAGNRFRRVPGNLTDQADVLEAFEVEHPGVDAARWFTQHPFVDPATDTTWVLSNQWGPRTLPALTALAETFPSTGVSFRPESKGED
jgi:hypothetical protein